MRGDYSNAWCILRTSGGKTLALANSLAKAEIDVWTPREIRMRLKPATRHQAKPVRIEREIAVMPSFVFARAAHVPELMAIRSSQTGPHPQFSIFTYAGRIPLVAESEMLALRKADEKSATLRRRQKRSKLVMGQRVTFRQGAWAGVSGIVEKLEGNFALVAFGGNLDVKIDAWLDDGDDVQDNEPIAGAAA